MTTSDVVRAWRDEEYRLSLSEAERAALPAHPAAWLELSDADLGLAAGAVQAMFTDGTAPHCCLTGITHACCGGGLD